jgi:hypothetical protein
MLVECGFVRATASDGSEWTFAPSFGRIATLGTPQEIVKVFADLHGAQAAETAAYVLASLCEQEDPLALVGWRDEELQYHPGLMPPTEQVLIARHLMQHGIIGKAKPSKGDGKYTDRFDASEYVSAARVHLGLSSQDAEALSMTEFQTMLEMKFPEANGRRDVPSREEYMASMKAIKERSRG